MSRLDPVIDAAERLTSGIEDRQRELGAVADILGRRANVVNRRASSIKVILILLGAFTATQGVAEQLFVSHSVAKAVTYTIAGLAISTLAGLEAAFKFEAQAAELKLLAAECHAMRRSIDSQWHTEVGDARGHFRIDAAKALIERQDVKLSEIQSRAAKAGVNITLEVRQLFLAKELYP